MNHLMNPSDPDPSLSRVLADWQVTPKSDPRFRPAVWQRIQVSTRETWATYVRAHLVGWTVATSLAVAAAVWTGQNAAQAKLEASREQMVVSYLVDLDPRVLAKLPH
jgi:hypothetical protein